MSGFRAGLMALQRPSVNVEAGSDDALLRHLLRAQAYMPDELRERYGYSRVSPEQRNEAIATFNDRVSAGDPNSDLFGNYRELPQGPTHASPPSNEMIGALIAGAPLAAPSFRRQSDAALSDQEISDLLRGIQAPADPFTSAMNSAGGAIDAAMLARLHGILLDAGGR